MNSTPNPNWFIPLLCHALRHDSPNNRILAAQALIALSPPTDEAIEALTEAITTDPDEIVRASIIQAIQSCYAPQSIRNMSDPPKIQMTFNSPVYGAAGNIEGNQVINVADQNFDALLNDYKQFFNNLQQKYPIQTPESNLQPIIDAEFQEIQNTQPQRWQNFLALKRLWNGGKKATFKMGEHFTEENLWGKMAIAFLEGVMEAD
jgi:HEAT repeat protein